MLNYITIKPELMERQIVETDHGGQGNWMDTLFEFKNKEIN
jgi:hypothetical protein